MWTQFNILQRHATIEIWSQDSSSTHLISSYSWKWSVGLHQACWPPPAVSWRGRVVRQIDELLVHGVDWLPPCQWSKSRLHSLFQRPISTSTILLHLLAAAHPSSSLPFVWVSIEIMFVIYCVVICATPITQLYVLERKTHHLCVLFLLKVFFPCLLKRVEVV